MPTNLKTVIHAYSFDTSNPDDAEAWKALRAKLRSSGVRLHESWSPCGNSLYNPKLDGAEIDLETKVLFSNQWNTAPIDGVSDKGLRVFDWAKDAEISGYCRKGVKRGHWLEQTDAMRSIRRNTNKCGYCGNQERAERGSVFCPNCLDSEYLKESDLFLLRMVAIDNVDKKGNQKRPPLTEAESTYLLPLYREAQLRGSTERGKARIAISRRSSSA